MSAIVTKSQPCCALLSSSSPFDSKAKFVSGSVARFRLGENNLHFAEADVGGGEGAGGQRLREAVLARLHPLRAARILDVLPDRSGHFEKVCVGELVRGPGSVSFRWLLLLLLFSDTGSDDVVEDVVERKRFAGMVVCCGNVRDTHGCEVGSICGFLYAGLLMEC